MKMSQFLTCCYGNNTDLKPAITLHWQTTFWHNERFSRKKDLFHKIVQFSKNIYSSFFNQSTFIQCLILL